MKPFVIVLCVLLAGCVGFHNATPPGDNSVRHVSAAEEFAGVYANSGVDIASRTQSPLAEFLFRYYDGKHNRVDRVVIRFPHANSLQIELRSGASVVDSKVMKEGVDYVFSGSMIIFESASHHGRSGSEAFPSTGLRSNRRAMWLNRTGELVAEDKRSAAGVAMGVIPGGGYSRNVWRWKRIEEEPNQTLEPTPIAVTPRADAQVAPATGVAHL